jgi:hypothetical protein
MRVAEDCWLDASRREIEKALRVVGKEYENEVDALRFWLRPKTPSTLKAGDIYERENGLN